MLVALVVLACAAGAAGALAGVVLPHASWALLALEAAGALVVGLALGAALGAAVL